MIMMVMLSLLLLLSQAVGETRPFQVSSTSSSSRGEIVAFIASAHISRKRKGRIRQRDRRAPFRIMTHADPPSTSLLLPQSLAPLPIPDEEGE